MDNRANYQVDIGGNVFIAIQNMFAEFTKIVQVVEKVDESVQNSTRQITEHVDKSANAFGGLQKQIERISLTSIIEQVKQSSGRENMPVIACSRRMTPSVIVAALNAGADDYVLKPFSLRELIARVHAVLRR